MPHDMTLTRHERAGAENLRTKGEYVLSYNNKHRQANWVCEVQSTQPLDSAQSHV